MWLSLGWNAVCGLSLPVLLIALQAPHLKKNLASLARH